MSLFQAILAIAILTTCSWLHAQDDGVYVGGQTDSAAIHLKLISGSIHSKNNANDRFRLDLCFDPEDRASGTAYHFVLAGNATTTSNFGRNGKNLTFLWDNLTLNEATSASKLFRLPLQVRQHPGHRIDAVFTTDKPEYAPNEAIIITVTLKNLGDEPLYFTRGLSGPKNTLFSFAPMSIPIGNTEVTKLYSGSFITVVETLPAHGEISMSTTLNEWFETKVPGRYHLLGSHLLELFKRPRSDSTVWESAVWVDYATRWFHFDVKRPE